MDVEKRHYLYLGIKMADNSGQVYLLHLYMRNLIFKIKSLGYNLVEKNVFCRDDNCNKFKTSQYAAYISK